MEDQSQEQQSQWLFPGKRFGFTQEVVWIQERAVVRAVRSEERGSETSMMEVHITGQREQFLKGIQARG